jgi:hypothetical protein
MKKIQLLNRLGAVNLSTVSLCCAMVTSLALVACGSGSSPAITQKPVVKTVATAQVLEGKDKQESLLEFVVTLDNLAVDDVQVTYSFSYNDKTTGYAKGGALCSSGSGIDFISVVNGPLTIKQGKKTGTITVRVCGDDLFEPNESLKITWSSAGASGGTVEGVIINDDAGGLNSTGSLLQLSGTTVFGRDVNILTNADADGALGFSFQKIDTCVVDEVTGLTWQKLPEIKKVYADLDAYVKSVNEQALCSHRDWRMPTANELMNLMDISKTTGVTANADSVVSADAMSGQFWASERVAGSTANAWRVSADENGIVDYANQSNLQNVRLVRGVQPVSTDCGNIDRFADHLDGTVSDTRTGLMWKSCPEGYSNNACSTGTVLPFGSVASVVTQLGKANSVVDKGYSDWRVPTRNEMASLVNRACKNPSIVSSVFPANESLAYITSSLSVNAPTTQVWSVDFTDGGVGPRFQSISYYLRLVRAGQ